MILLLDKAAAILRRDLLTAIRHRSGFVLAIAGALAEIAGLYYLSRAIGPGFRPDGMDSYSFLLLGTGFYTFMIMGVSSLVTAVQEAQQAGTLEVLMNTSTPPTVLVGLSALSAFAGKGASFLLFILGGFIVFGVPARHLNLLGAGVVIGLSVAVALAIGILGAALQLAIQKGSAIVWLLSSGVWIVTGTMFPVSALPRSLQVVSRLVPITHAVQGFRLAVLGGWSPALAHELLLLVIFAAILLPPALLAFGYALRQARLNGTLSFC